MQQQVYVFWGKYAAALHTSWKCFFPPFFAYLLQIVLVDSVMLVWTSIFKYVTDSQ